LTSVASSCIGCAGSVLGVVASFGCASVISGVAAAVSALGSCMDCA